MPTHVVPSGGKTPNASLPYESSSCTEAMNGSACFILPQGPLVGVINLLRAFRVSVTYMLAGSYALFGFRNTSGQLARRGRDIHIARYHVEDKEERTAFVAALKYLLEQVPLTCDLNALLSRWRWFAEGGVGCIGVLKDWLVAAGATILVQQGTNLTEEILTRTM